MKNLQNIILLFFLTLSVVSLGLNFYLFQENTALEKNLTEKEVVLIKEKKSAVNFQRGQKNEIANLFDNQAALNDDLTDEQKRLIQAATDYISFIDSNVRFIDGEPQLLENLTETTMLERKNTLAKAIVDLQKLAKENSDQKTQLSERIKQLYLLAGEDRDNSANDREGIRGEKQ
jgi:hypothetical protein